MNEELQKALGELLNKTLNGIDTASGFLTEQLPEVIQQLLMWHGVYSLVTCILSLVYIISIPFQVKHLFNKIPDKIKEGDEDNWWWKDENRRYPSFSFKVSMTDGAISYIGFFGVMNIACFCVATSYLNLEWLQIWLAPKVWLLEYAAKLTG